MLTNRKYTGRELRDTPLEFKINELEESRLDRFLANYLSHYEEDAWDFLNVEGWSLYHEDR